MPYQTGPAANPVDLLDAFMTFCVAAGWTQDAYGIDPSVGSTGKAGHLHKGTKYIHLRSFINENSNFLGGNSSVFGSGIAIIPGGSYVADPTWWKQANIPFNYLGNILTQPITMIMPLPAGAIQNYWMFADAAGDNVHLVALKQSGVYTHLGFGDMIKPDAYTGGFYCLGTRHYAGAFLNGPGVTTQNGPPGSAWGLLRASVDSLPNYWHMINANVAAPGAALPGKRVNPSTAPTLGATWGASEHISYGAFRLRARSTRTQGLVLLPTHWMIERDFGGAISGGGWSFAGTVPDVFQCNSTGFAPGEQYDISTDEYIVFPEFAVRKHA